MAYDGSGNFVRLYNWVTDKLNLVNITASRMDSEDNGFAAGLSNCVTRDGQGKMGADFLPSTDNTLNLGSAVARWATLNGISSAFVIPQQAVKPATTARSGTAVSNDPDLVLPIAAGGTYEIDITIIANRQSGAGSAASFLEVNFSGTLDSAGGNTLALGGVFGGAAAGGTLPINSLLGGFLWSTTSFLDCLFLRGNMVCVGAGNVALQWSGNGSLTASFYKGSSMKVRRLA